MDVSDRATAQEEEMRERGIAELRSSEQQLPAVGCCYNCGSSVPAGARFCDADCRDDWQKRRDAEIRRGRE